MTQPQSSIVELQPKVPSANMDTYMPEHGVHYGQSVVSTEVQQTNHHSGSDQMCRSVAGDWTPKVHAFRSHPAQTSTNPYGHSCQLVSPRCLFRLCPTKPYGQRPSHQMLTSCPAPKLVPGRGPHPGKANSGTFMLLIIMVLLANALSYTSDRTWLLWEALPGA